MTETTTKIHLANPGDAYTACGRRITASVPTMEVLHERLHHVDCGSCLRTKAATS